MGESNRQLVDATGEVRTLLFGAALGLVNKLVGGSAVLGPSTEPTIRAYRASLVGDAQPGVWIEVPLTGAPGFDMNAFYRRDQVRVGDRFVCGDGFGYQPVIDWLCSAPQGGFGVGLAHDLRGDEVGHGAYVNPNGAGGDCRNEFFCALGEVAAGERSACVIERQPQEWQVMEEGVFADREGRPARIASKVGERLQRAYAADVSLLEAHLRQVGFWDADADMLACLRQMARSPFELWLINLTICPTMGCNFDCPYCFEDHLAGKMSPEVQDDVVALDEGRGATYEAGVVTNGYLLTPQITKTLARCRVTKMQVTIDGMGAAHDATRHLAGGGPTFERIVQNLSRPGLPFRVDVRHNVHKDNRAEVEGLREFVNRIAADSGNDLAYYSALVIDTQTAERRGRQVGIVGVRDATDVLLEGRLGMSGVHPIHCGAGTIWDVGVDPQGRLHKCWEAVDKSELSFGNAHDWDPADPLASSKRPDLLTCFLNCAQPLDDEECRACLWLPLCAGGCPYERLFNGARKCLPYKDDPARYALALHSASGRHG